MARTYNGRDSGRLRGLLWASGGPPAGAEGLLDVLARDLVAAGYAVGVGGEQDTDAVPGAGRDLGGRGAGGQPQRQRGMTQVVGEQVRPAWCYRGTLIRLPMPAYPPSLMYLVKCTWIWVALSPVTSRACRSSGWGRTPGLLIDCLGH